MMVGFTLHLLFNGYVNCRPSIIGFIISFKSRVFEAIPPKPSFIGIRL